MAFKNFLLSLSIYRLGNIVVASNKDGEPVTADDLVSFTKVRSTGMFLIGKRLSSGRSILGSFLKAAACSRA